MDELVQKVNEAIVKKHQDAATDKIDNPTLFLDALTQSLMTSDGNADLNNKPISSSLSKSNHQNSVSHKQLINQKDFPQIVQRRIPNYPAKPSSDGVSKKDFSQAASSHVPVRVKFTNPSSEKSNQFPFTIDSLIQNLNLKDSLIQTLNLKSSDNSSPVKLKIRPPLKRKIDSPLSTSSSAPPFSLDSFLGQIQVPDLGRILDKTVKDSSNLTLETLDKLRPPFDGEDILSDINEQSKNIPFLHETINNTQSIIKVRKDEIILIFICF